MARFDFHANPAGAGYLLDLQADLMRSLSIRIVAPLLPLSEAPQPARRLNPIFDIGGDRLVMVTQFLAAVPVTELGTRTGSLAHERDAITNALDMVFSGF